MIISNEYAQEHPDYDEYRWTAVLDELARPLPRRLKVGEDELRDVWLPADTVVAPRYHVWLRVTDKDPSVVTFVGGAAYLHQTGWYMLAPDADKRQVAEIKFFESEGDIDLRTGEMKLKRVPYGPGNPPDNARVWLVAFLKTYGPWRGVRQNPHRRRKTR